MDIYLIAKIFALVWVVVGLGMLMNTKYYMNMIKGFKNDSPMVYVGGVMALVIGYLLVTYYNNWVQSWEVIITLAGWAALIKGLCLLLFPKAFMDWQMGLWKSEGSVRFMAVVVLVLGLVVGYYGGLFGMMG